MEDASTGDRTVAILRDLVAFDTTSRTSNLALIEFVEAYLGEHGVASRRVPEQGDRVNLYATIGPTDVPGVMLSGHTDVVPVTGQKWTSDPFTLVERDGRLYGRGAADMKGFVAAVLAMVPTFATRRLHTPVHLAFSYDEEIGCVGVRNLLAEMTRMPVRPGWGIVGEPTSMRPVNAHKGKTAYRVRVTGHACHSRNPDAGVNAIDAAATLIGFIRTLADECRRDGPYDSDYEYPCSSLHVGRIEGGTALNIVPAECHFDFEIRHLPEEDVDALVDRIREYAAAEIEPAMRAIDPDCGVAFEPLSAYPGLTTAEDTEAATKITALLDESTTGKIAFGTEGGLFHREADVPCVVCGPGSIDQAHQPDEYVTREQLSCCDRFLDRLAGHLAA